LGQKFKITLEINCPIREYLVSEAIQTRQTSKLTSLATISCLSPQIGAFSPSHPNQLTPESTPEWATSAQ